MFVHLGEFGQGRIVLVDACECATVCRLFSKSRGPSNIRMYGAVLVQEHGGMLAGDRLYQDYQAVDDATRPTIYDEGYHSYSVQPWTRRDRGQRPLYAQRSSCSRVPTKGSFREIPSTQFLRGLTPYGEP